MNRVLRAASTVTLVFILLTACGERQPSDAGGPEQTAVQLFELAQSEQPNDELIATLFGEGMDELKRVALLEALSALPAPSAVEMTGSETLEGVDRVAVDFSAGLPSGGLARFSVQVEPTPLGQWRIFWFQGPGLEWPRREPPRDEGLTTSALPAGDGVP